MSDDEIHDLVARKNKLEEQLNQKLNADYNELLRKSNESYQNMRLSTARFYRQKAAEELDALEKDLQAGNNLGAISRKIMADSYLALANNV